MVWPVFWCEMNGEAHIILRRFTFSDRPPCSDGTTYHDATTPVGYQPIRWTSDSDARRSIASVPATEYLGDPRWPLMCCRCDYRFVGDDEWQVGQEPVYVRGDTGESWWQRDLPAGAMFDSWWAPTDWRNPVDDLAVTVVLPDLCEPGFRYDARSHFWNVDGPATGDGRLTPHAWTRTGDPKAVPPTISVTPSIDARGSCYHSYLTDGVLLDG